LRGRARQGTHDAPSAGVMDAAWDSTLWLRFSSNGLGDARRPSWSWLCHRRVVGDVSSPPNEREFASTLQHQIRHILPLAGSRKSSVFRLLSFTKRVWTGIIPWRDAR